MFRCPGEGSPKQVRSSDRKMGSSGPDEEGQKKKKVMKKTKEQQKNRRTKEQIPKGGPESVLPLLYHK